MLQLVDVAAKPLDRYEAIIGSEKLAELKELGAPHRRKRVAHINATVYGGGVSELLRSLVPLYRALGIEADWLVIPGSPEFFEVTKGIHNALQGAPFDLTEQVKEVYLAQNRQIGGLLDREYDFIVVHDPQPAPLRVLHGRNIARWVWRCHIDTSHPNAEVLLFLKPYLGAYDALVFTMQEFVPADLSERPVAIVPPAIDPLSPKNMVAPMEMDAGTGAGSLAVHDHPHLHVLQHPHRLAPAGRAGRRRALRALGEPAAEHAAVRRHDYCARS
ncbi:MAG: hypothetical protein WEE64_00680 [Dehalococcoidia bacterium]